MGSKNPQFSANISLYLGNGTREASGYYETLKKVGPTGPDLSVISDDLE